MPRVLVASALIWPNAVRLCSAFREVGFDVSAIAVPQHPVHRSKAPNRTFDYRTKAPLESLREAIAKQAPDIIIPCDDRILGHLCALRAAGDAASGLIETSLGRGGADGDIAKRGALAEIRGLPDLDIPRTDNVDSVSDLRDWAHKHGLPAVLKLDGSWGGNDVVVVRRETDIRRAFWEMRLRQSAFRGLRRYVMKHDVEALRSRPRPAISVQSFVAGRPANAAVACWRGEVIAQVAVEAVALASPFGMATVVRVVDGDAMIAAARSICRHYRLSGLHGFDFVIEEGTGAVKLIEINPRATQIGHFPLGPGRDLAAALFEAISGRSTACRRPIESADVSLFPGEWRRDPRSAYLASTFHDVPTDEMDLARYYGFDPFRDLAPLAFASPQGRR
jgi:hypothetical protein